MYFVVFALPNNPETNNYLRSRFQIMGKYMAKKKFELVIHFWWLLLTRLKILHNWLWWVFKYYMCGSYILEKTCKKILLIFQQTQRVCFSMIIFFVLCCQ